MRPDRFTVNGQRGAAIYRFRNSRLKNFPVGVFGTSSMISMTRKYLKAASFSLQNVLAQNAQK
jgi:hypothetical protein